MMNGWLVHNLCYLMSFEGCLCIVWDKTVSELSLDYNVWMLMLNIISSYCLKTRKKYFCHQSNYSYSDDTTICERISIRKHFSTAKLTEMSCVILLKKYNFFYHKSDLFPKGWIIVVQTKLTKLATCLGCAAQHVKELCYQD